MSTGDYDCPPVPLPVDASIMALAANVGRTATLYRSQVDGRRVSYADVVKLGCELARLSEQLVTRLVDVVNDVDEHSICNGAGVDEITAGSACIFMSKALTRSGVSHTLKP